MTARTVNETIVLAGCRGCVGSGEADQYPEDYTCEPCQRMLAELDGRHGRPVPPPTQKQRPCPPCQWEGCRNLSRHPNAKYCLTCLPLATAARNRPRNATAEKHEQDRRTRGEKYKARVAAGLCGGCGGTPVPDRVRCGECLRRQMVYYQHKARRKP